jgi:predicted RNase H-like HicB family nuclease
VNHYTYRAEWSSERGEYVGRCLELPWLSQWAPTMQQAIADVERAVDEYLADCEGGRAATNNRTAIQRQVRRQDIARAAFAPDCRSRRAERVDESMGRAEAG